jgi:hypothetical protein
VEVELGQWLAISYEAFFFTSTPSSGCSHIGIIKAMHEVGIPIDMVGGTSIGSCMGAIWVDELNVTRATQRAREFCLVRLPMFC